MAAADSPLVIGFSFVSQYYKMLHEKPGSLFRFYKNESLLVYNGQEAVKGSENIGAFFEKLNLLGSGVKVTCLQAQESVETSYVEGGETKRKAGVIVAVQGVFTPASGPSAGKERLFSQSFFLAAQPKGFYVYNDVFVYHDNYPALPGPITFTVKLEEPAPAVSAPTPGSVLSVPVAPTVATTNTALTPIPVPDALAESAAPAPAPTPAPAKPVLEKIETPAVALSVSPVEAAAKRVAKLEKQTTIVEPVAARPARKASPPHAPTPFNSPEPVATSATAGAETVATTAAPAPKIWAAIVVGKSYVPPVKSVAEQQLEEEKAKEKAEQERLQKQKPSSGRSTTPRQEREPREVKPTKLVNVSLPPSAGSISDDALRNLFAKFGKVISIDNKTSEKNSATLEFETPEIASNVVAEATKNPISLGSGQLRISLRGSGRGRQSRHPGEGSPSAPATPSSGERRPRRSERSPKEARPDRSGGRNDRSQGDRKTPRAPRPATAPSPASTSH